LVRETVEKILEKWNENKRAYDLPEELRQRIDEQMTSIKI
jgi:hypothetical protein